MGEWALTRAKERLKDDELSDAQNKPKASGRLFKGNWCDQDVIFFIKKNHFLISSAYSPAPPFPPKCFGVYLFTDFYRLKAVFVSTVSLHSSVKQQQLWDRTWEREKKKKQFPLRQQKGQQEGHRTDEKTANSFTDFLIWGSWYKNIPGSDVQTEACLYIYKIKWSANHTRRFMLTVFLKHTKMSRMYHQLLLATMLVPQKHF